MFLLSFKEKPLDEKGEESTATVLLSQGQQNKFHFSQTVTDQSELM